MASAPHQSGDQEGPRLRGPWWLGRRRQLSAEQRENLLSQLFFEGAERRVFLVRFATLLAFSVMIATFGLAQDSAPVVIGAMLVSPLSTPLLGLSAALVMGWPRRQLESLLILAVGSLGAIGLAALTLLLIPEPKEITLQSEQLLDRTTPGLLDLAVAIIAGGAGAYVLLRREAVSALPGVAIAVALVPPISAVGMTLELGRSSLAGEALILYLTNVAGIVLAGSVVMLLAGVRPETDHGRLTRRARVGIASALLAVAAVAYPLTEATRDRVAEASAHDDATAIVEDHFEGTDYRLRDLEVEDETVTIDVTGPRPLGNVDPLADRLAAELGREITLSAGWIREQIVEASGGD